MADIDDELLALAGADSSDDEGDASEHIKKDSPSAITRNVGRKPTPKRSSSKKGPASDSEDEGKV